MNDEIEKKAEELAKKVAYADGLIEITKDAILEACRFTERVTMDNVANTCGEWIRPKGTGNHTIEYATACADLHDEFKRLAIEAAAREGK